MSKVYLVMGQRNNTIEPIAVFRNESEADACAENHRDAWSDYWVERMNLHE